MARSPKGISLEDEDLLAQFIAGTNHEMEHTDKWYEAARTTLDHLRENKRYYSVLKKVFPAEGARDAAAVQMVGRGLRFNPGAPRENPYPNFHTARQEDPGEFVRFRAKYVYHGAQPIEFVYGFPREGSADGGSRVQSLRFPAEYWTDAAACRWLLKHGYTTTWFQPATG